MRATKITQGNPTSGAAKEAMPKNGGGQGFLINHKAFTDARPPGRMGMRKSAGYPSFNK